MDEMSVEKWWNEICGRGKREKPQENLPRPRFAHHEIHMEWPRRELGAPAVGGESLTACATRLPNIQYLTQKNILYPEIYPGSKADDYRKLHRNWPSGFQIVTEETGKRTEWHTSENLHTCSIVLDNMLLNQQRGRQERIVISRLKSTAYRPRNKSL